MMENKYNLIFFSIAIIAISVIVMIILFIVQNPIILLLLGLGFTFSITIIYVIYIEFTMTHKYIIDPIIEEVEKHNLEFLTDEEIEEYLYDKIGRNTQNRDL